MTTETRNDWQLIGRGWVGWHAERGGTSSSGGTLEHYLEQAEGGARVYDASEANPDEFARFVIRGPMVRTDRDPESWHKFGHDDDTPGALDDMGVDRYLRLMRERVHGVSFGQVLAGGEIGWEVMRS